MSHYFEDDSELWRAYTNTVFRATVDGMALEIRPGYVDSEVDEVLARKGAMTWAFITAWNPGSKALALTENQARQTRLREDVERLGFKMFDGVGEPVGSGWTPEESVLILGISTSDAIALGTKYGQVAIVFGRWHGPAELVRCDSK